MPVGVPAKPGQVVKAQVPCSGSVMRVKFGDKGPDGIYPHEKMEVYAMGFRNQSGVAFGPKGSRLRTPLRSLTTAPTIWATAASPTLRRSFGS